MENNYKAILSNKELYLEIELPHEERAIRVGTVPGSRVRLHKHLFFEDFWIQFTNIGDTWRINSSDNTYIYCGDIRKLSNKPLNNGETIDIRYQDSNSTLFTVEFGIDFNNEQRKYQRAIDVKKSKSISIGTDNSNQIILGSSYTNNEKVKLSKEKNELRLIPIKSSYGICYNGSKIQTDVVVYDTDFFSIADFIFCYKNGLLWTEIRDDFQVNGLSYYDCPDTNSYPRFVRNTRERITVNKEQIEVLDPPDKPSKPRNNLVTNLLPSMGMIATSGIMAAMGDSMILYSVLSGSMAIVIAVATLIQNNSDYKKDVNERIERYRLYEQRKRKEISGLREKEKSELEYIYIDTTEKERRLLEFSRDLFDRIPTDPDFLDVRLGTGTVKAIRKISYRKRDEIETDDELQVIPQQIADDFMKIENTPVICHLKNANAIGIIGKEEYRYEMVKNILLDLCTRQFISDISLFFIAKPEHADKIYSLRFLPQVNNSSIGFRCIAFEDEGKNRVFDLLYQALSGRDDEIHGEHIIVFFYDEYGFQIHPVSKYLLEANKHNATFIFMADAKGDIPIGCSQHIYADSRNTGHLVTTSDKNETIDFMYESVSDTEIEKMVSILAPVYTEELSLESSLTKSITLFELLGIVAADDLDLKERWNSSKVYNSLAAPIGVSKSEVVYLDLHDKAHGPHGLVAGTTGSGKSELLQTFILSTATIFHPYEVGFVIIDFKGGGMVNQFKDLPHLLGAITNIDGKEINRSLKFIKAELNKRQRLFAEASVNHIDKYIKRYKAGEVNVPLPHLILIVDEFAELKAEQPEFMQELISAARIGRSLGVHLILATQKPSGQVDDQIWSNSRFKICLKVQDQEDSNEVLKSPLAAEIKEPGRAYLQVGNNEIFTLLQSAYSGAPERIGDNSIKEFAIYEITESGRKKTIFEQKRKKAGDSVKNQLEAIVEHVRIHFMNSNQKPLQGICLPSLKSIIDYPGNNLDKNAVSIGMYDDPDNQFQGPAYIDIDNKNTFILGSSQYGKTNLLMSLIRSITDNTSPLQSVFYILDFGAMVLKNFENLNHVGGVVSSSEDEKLNNLLKLLSEEVTIRKEKLHAVGVGSFSSYLESGYTDLPHIYLFIDNMTAAMELYFEDDERLLSLIREGLAVGISTIVTAVQTAGINYRYLSNFANKICLYCNDSAEYANMFDHVSLEPDEKPGRCIIEVDKYVYECQTYLAFCGEKEIDRINSIRKYVKLTNDKHKNKKAKKIPCIPPVLSLELLNEEYDCRCVNYNVPIGLSYEEVSPVFINFIRLGVMGLCGGKSEDRIGFIRTIIRQLELHNKDRAIETVVIDDVYKELESIKHNVSVVDYTLNIDAIQEIIDRWYEVLEDRYNKLIYEDSSLGTERLLLLLINNNDVAKRIDEDIDLSDKFNEIVTRFKNLGVAIIFTNYQNNSVPYDAPAPLVRIRDDRHLLYFDEIDKLKPIEVPYEVIRANKRQLEKGDAFYIRDDHFEKLKLVTC